MALGLTFLAFFVKTVTKMRLTDPQMSIWDGAALMAGVGASLAVVASMYRERRKHEGIQNVFAPSLREELDRGISQVDFELSYSSTSRMWNVPALVSFGTGVLLCEIGRLNGESTPWTMFAVAVGGVLVSVWVGFAAKKRKPLNRSSSASARLNRCARRSRRTPYEESRPSGFVSRGSAIPASAQKNGPTRGKSRRVEVNPHPVAAEPRPSIRHIIVRPRWRVCCAAAGKSFKNGSLLGTGVRKNG